MKLIGANTSPFVRKVRIVIAEKKIECQYVLEDVWHADTTIQAVNPLGKVPALVMEDGGAVFDSRVIAEYLDTISPLHRLIPPSGRARLEVKCWEALADGMLDAAVLARLEESQRTPEQRSAAWVARQMSKIDAGLKAMEQGIGDKEWACDGKHSLADIALGCTLGYLDFRFAQLDWRAAHPSLKTYFQRLSKRQSYIDTQPG
jgi:glutathione S-transferase